MKHDESSRLKPTASQKLSELAEDYRYLAQNEDGEVLHFFRKVLDEARLLRHHRAEHERAKDLVDAERIGHQAAGNEQQEDDGQHILR